MAPYIGLIVTGRALQDFCVFLKTLQVWHPDATLYIFTDTATAPAIRELPFELCTVHIKECLDKYKGLTRQTMEATPGTIYKTLWTDFMYEKVNVIEWMLGEKEEDKEKEAWFLDADIAFLAPLPSIPSTATVALSPHYIRPRDEALYGRYNGGFLWIRSKALLEVWRVAGHTARFYEQSALEEVAKEAGASLHTFPIQVNFGWWRMIQSTESPLVIQSKFSLFRQEEGTGIRYDGHILQSIHTHWYDTTGDPAYFNQWIRAYCEKFRRHPPIQKFLNSINLFVKKSV